ncbi:MAG: hypothetical protein WKF84_12350 [Pyrinomonadaceae bacterium]
MVSISVMHKFSSGALIGTSGALSVGTFSRMLLLLAVIDQMFWQALLEDEG